jgi:homoserine O-succinyltransferase
MPVFVEAVGGRPLGAREQHIGSNSETIRIALVNNMPDAALEDTETQFRDLLNKASQGVSVHLKLVSLPNVPRSKRGLERLEQLYYRIDELWKHSYDAIIVTGTEPKYADLRQEPYWSSLASLFDWAEHNTISTILSCLAAHAGVLYSDGIARVRLPDKMFGVFDFTKASEHALTSRSGDVLCFPHSRWNGLPADALAACGYQVLTRNGKAGVDSFVKRKGASLVVHFQGHPEYQAHTLFKEYRRDIKRFLLGERETYPTPPYGYFSNEAINYLNDFQRKALASRGEAVMAEFPEVLLTRDLRSGWHASAVRLYRNWFEFISEKKAETSCYTSMRVRRSRNAVPCID